MKNKTKLSKSIIVVASTILLIAVVAFAGRFLASANSRDNQNPAKQKEMMAIILEWGRLSPFPTSATNVSIETEGNSFTRSFRARFVAPKQDVITPGGGASKAEVTIDYVLNQLEIYVSWG